MTRATGVESPTGIRGLHRSITGEPGVRLQSPGKLSAAVRSRADKTSPEAEPINSEAVRMRASEVVRKWIAAVVHPAKWIVAAPSAAWTVAVVQRVISATVEARAVKACPVVAEDLVEVPVVVEGLVEVLVAVVVAVEGGRHVKI